MSRLLRLETVALFTIILVGSLLPVLMFESVRDSTQPQSILFQDYSALFKSLVSDDESGSDQNEFEFGDEDEDPVPEIFTILKNRKELANSQLFHLATDWQPHFKSNRCLALKQSGAESAKSIAGMGARPSCVAVPSESAPAAATTSKHNAHSFLNTPQAMVHISTSHRVLYIPSISMFKMRTFFGFEHAIKRRFRTKQIPERLLPLYLKHLKLNVTDFFVFTFVQNPLTHFAANYNLLKVNKSVEAGFHSSPVSALQALERSQRALAPKGRDENALLLFNQVFKTMRCVPNAVVKKYKQQVAAPKEVLNFDFIGHVENLQDDWRYIEAVLGVSHVPLQWPSGLTTVEETHLERLRKQQQGDRLTKRQQQLLRMEQGRIDDMDEISDEIFTAKLVEEKEEEKPAASVEESLEEEKPAASMDESLEEESVEEEMVEEEEEAAPAPNQNISPSELEERRRLKKAVCDYYRADFECFGYEDSICEE